VSLASISPIIRDLSITFQRQASMHSRLDYWAFSLRQKFTVHDYHILGATWLLSSLELSSFPVINQSVIWTSYY
jgi:hypothetical protein